MKRVLFISLAVIIVGVVTVFYVSLNGNPITKMFAKKKVAQYVEETYAGQTTRLLDSGYNFKDSRYYFLYEMTSNDIEANYTISTGGPVLLNDRVYSYLHVESADEDLTNAFQQAGTAFLTEQLHALNIQTDSIGYTVDIPKGLYTNDVSWQPTVEEKLQPFIAIELTNEAQTEAEFLAQVKTIEQMLKDERFTYREAQVQMYRQVNDGGNTYYEAVYTTVFNEQTEKLTLLK